MTRRTRAVIHVEALQHNLAQARQAAPDSRVMAVIKADGYGHGLLRVAAALRHADAFAVTCLEEAIPLREAGYAHPILLLAGPFEPVELEACRRYRLDIVVHAPWQVALLESAPAGRALTVWLKIDSGMHRLGLMPEQVPEMHRRLTRCAAVNPHIRLLTHMACADDREDPRSTPDQMQRFMAVAEGLGGEHSLANSAAVLGWPQTHADWVRPGVMLYGVDPFCDQRAERPTLRPAMTLCSPLIAIRHVAAGERIGYGGTWTCSEDTTVGVVAIGYGDGYPRHAPSGTPVLVAGQASQLLGRVSMDLICIDLTGLEQQVQIGDDVVLWGRGLPVEQIAARCGTIAYELLCGVSPRVHRELETGHGPGTQ
ncbi:alanine racemase [Methylonatrum kenyense]|uniref:alanine racemase n=1 Tax=Methylonatrum kenyense TaxID=455253 RepID=UPI0020BEF85B|nr:alanine racemase [Methylonatrum kenyense]